MPGPFKHGDLLQWQTRTGGRSRLSRTPPEILAVDDALEVAIKTGNNEAYLAALGELGDRLKAVTGTRGQRGMVVDRGLWTVGHPVRDLFDQVTEEKMQTTLALGREARAAADAVVVNIEQWVDANLPQHIVANAPHNCVGEDAQLRSVRRSCLKRQLQFDHGKPLECEVGLIIQVANGYLDPQRHWAPGQRCHFVVQHCGLGGVQEFREVQNVSDQEQQIVEYISAVFHRQRSGGNSIKHSIRSHQGGARISDPTWTQFFPGIRPGGRFPNIFSGTEEDFRAMFR